LWTFAHSLLLFVYKRTSKSFPACMLVLFITCILFGVKIIYHCSKETQTINFVPLICCGVLWLLCSLCI
jgi:hypothetical protein